MTPEEAPNSFGKPPDAVVTFWVIYDHPNDAPHAYVLRPQFAIRGQPKPQISPLRWFADNADKLRGILPFGATYLGRHDQDDPKILEVWME